jgi:hypothetical protein
MLPQGGSAAGDFYVEIKLKISYSIIKYRFSISLQNSVEFIFCSFFKVFKTPNLINFLRNNFLI